MAATSKQARRRASRTAVAFSLALLALVGCGGGDKWPGEVDTVPARGRITAAGQPLAGAHLLFHPVNSAQATKAQANVGPDGDFVVRTFRSGDGGISGEYVITVGPNTAPEFGDERYTKANVDLHEACKAVVAKIPKAYTDVRTSPLKVVIDKSKPDLGQLELK